ncbi:MAG: cysteine desulfurase [Candidatus Nanopelagicaceae bacterium]
MLDVAKLKQDFPIFDRTIRDGQRLIYLDSGATAQKPNQVIDAEVNFYKNHNAAVHRGAHQLAEEATENFENARSIVAEFIGAGSDEIVFTKNATESINLVAYALTSKIKPGARIVVSEMEHHANLIPWQQLAKRTSAELAWFEVTPEGRLDLSNINSVITTNTAIVAITHQSNVLGTINPLDAIVRRAQEVGAEVLLDACQSVPHMPVNVHKLGIDYLAFSGHKALGPTGVGVLWGKNLEELPPFLFGGSMIENVTMTDATWAPAPKKFEAGVPNMAQAIGLSAALQYLSKIGLNSIHEHELYLTKALLAGLTDIKGLEIFGPENLIDRGGTVSFIVDGIHPHDLGQFLDSKGVAVRTGHHCAWPLARKFTVQATTRASLYLYNDLSDIDALLSGIQDAKKFFLER